MFHVLFRIAVPVIIASVIGDLVQAQDSSVVHGLVTDEAGSPVQDVFVRVESDSGSRQTVRTVADGSYSVEFPAGAVSVRLQFDGSWKGYEPILLEPEDRRQIDVTLTRMASISGTVATEGGDLLSGVLVDTRPPSPRPVRTDAYGRYKLYVPDSFGPFRMFFQRDTGAGASDGQWYFKAFTEKASFLLALKPGQEIEAIDAIFPVEADDETDPGRETDRVSVDSAGAIYGVVTDTGGVPVADVRLEFSPVEGTVDSRTARVTRSGPDGRFELLVPPGAGAGTLTASAARHKSWYHSDASSLEASQLIAVDPGMRVEVNPIMHPKVLTIWSFRSGLVCKPDEETGRYTSHEIGIRGAGEICEAAEIPIEGEGRCIYDEEERLCTWFGFTFFYDGWESDEPISCEWHRSSAVDEGNPDEVVQRGTRSGGFEIEFEDRYAGRHTHQMYEVHETEYDWLVVDMEVWCRHGGEILFSTEFEIIHSSTF